VVNITTYILAAIALLQGVLTLIDGIRSARYMRTFRPRRTTRERVVIFCPCKGTDSEFEKNIRSILDQDYQNYEAQFIVESADDSAYETLLGLGGNILVAGRATSRGQKVHNLAYAVEHAPAADI
jgi:cellulose synthase/poly-beta-1,6-N-acetylglucosamine synthase-like glycosyltransferase